MDTKKEYRTREQYEEIVESMENGNWTQAAEFANDSGFWVTDLLNFFDEDVADNLVDTFRRAPRLRDFLRLTEKQAELREAEAVEDAFASEENDD